MTLRLTLTHAERDILAELLVIAQKECLKSSKLPIATDLQAKLTDAASKAADLRTRVKGLQS